MKTLLFIGAHPDDETLCTGLFLKAKKLGFETAIIACSEGKNGKPNQEEQDDMIKKRNEEFETYCDMAGVGFRKILATEGILLSKNEKTIIELVSVMRKLRPDVVITHMNNDYHEEHQVVHEMVKSALEISCRSSFTDLGPKLIDTLLLEVDGLELINNPDIYLDISEVFDEKIKIISAAYQERLGGLIEMDVHKAKMRGSRKKILAAECYSLVPVTSTSYSSGALKTLSDLIA